MITKLTLSFNIKAKSALMPDLDPTFSRKREKLGHICYTPPGSP
jgi:hypothetical protein